MTLIQYLRKQNQEKKTFTKKELVKLYPKEKETIERFIFVGLIESISENQIYTLCSKVVS
jgi:hypothetical protein